MKKPNILLIYTGGTIGMIRQIETGSLQPFKFDNLLENIPELKHINAEISTHSFENPIDSSNMAPEIWTELALLIEKNYNQFDGFVVLHGSDTMAYSASALSFMLENLAKPVVFTGSQLPIGIIRTDGKENLITAIEIAAATTNLKPTVPEVCIYFEYKLYRANRTLKDNSEHFKAFRSPNYPVLANAGIEIEYNFNAIKNQPENLPFKVNSRLSKEVAIIKLFPGISEAFMQCVLFNPGIKLIVIESFGAGNMPTYSWFVDLLKKAIKSGKIILNITQCLTGTVTHGLYETSSHLESIGVISGKDLTAEAAITKAMFLLANFEHQEVVKRLNQNLVGEITA